METSSVYFPNKSRRQCDFQVLLLTDRRFCGTGVQTITRKEYNSVKTSGIFLCPREASTEIRHNQPQLVLVDFYSSLSLSLQLTSSSSAGRQRKDLTRGPCVFLWRDHLNVNPFRLFGWRQEHFVPGAQNIHLSVGAGVHRADEKHCLPIMYSKRWWLRGFSCSSPLLKHMALNGCHWKSGRETFFSTLNADWISFLNFLQAAHDASFSQDTVRMMHHEKW